MKKELFDAYNNCKSIFVARLTDALLDASSKDLKVSFSPHIVINMPDDPEDELCETIEDITDVMYDAKEDTWYVHNFITDNILQSEEYYTPLRDLSMTELYKIAEKL